MVENQLRPNKIKDPIILNLFKQVPKESFLPETIKGSPYSDLDINLKPNRGYLKNLHIAQLLNHSKINNNHKVLHLGALTGYVSFLLANLSSEVIAVETDEELREILQKNINKFDIKNIKVVKGSFKEGFKSESPFDVIFIDTPINKLDNIIIDQLSNDLGKIIMIKKDKNYLSQALRITKNKDNFNQEYLFDIFSKYELYKDSEGFIF